MIISNTKSAAALALVVGMVAGGLAQVSQEAPGAPLRMKRKAQSPNAEATRGLPGRVFQTADKPDQADDPRSQAIFDKLEEKVRLGFSEQTLLWDVINYMSVACGGPNDKDGRGFSFDFDDEGIKKIGKDRHSPIPVALEGEDMPIKSALQRILDPMGLTYSVKDGVLTIIVKPASSPKTS
jgi:hypothetical protein